MITTSQFEISNLKSQIMVKSSPVSRLPSPNSASKVPPLSPDSLLPSLSPVTCNLSPITLVVPWCRCAVVVNSPVSRLPSPVCGFAVRGRHA